MPELAWSKMYPISSLHWALVLAWEMVLRDYQFQLKIARFGISIAEWHHWCTKKNRPRQDSNLQSPDPKSGALSIRPHGLTWWAGPFWMTTLTESMVKYLIQLRRFNLFQFVSIRFNPFQSVSIWSNCKGICELLFWAALWIWSKV